jgi:hypothetical protein
LPLSVLIAAEILPTQVDVVGCEVGADRARRAGVADQDLDCLLDPGQGLTAGWAAGGAATRFDGGGQSAVLGQDRTDMAQLSLQFQALPAASFQAIGLTAAEDAAYELLVDRPSSTLNQLAIGWVRTERLESVLADLDAKGLIQRLPGEPTQYSIVAPDIAMDALFSTTSNSCASPASTPTD